MMGGDVRVRYTFDDNFAQIDKAIYEAAGRISDYAGADNNGLRDHGWTSRSEIDKKRIISGLRRAGFGHWIVAS